MKEKQKISKSSIVIAMIFLVIIVATLLAHLGVFNGYKYSKNDREMISSAIQIIDDFENGTLSAKEASTKMENLTNLVEKQADDKTLSVAFSSAEISLSLSDNKLVSSDSQSKWLENVKERRESFKKMLKERK
ncbi:MAG: hypothetical protein ACLR1Z_06100 [Eubacterium sp.]|nr:MAG TPA: hypothetical protein [Caudoviricetes sp.]DAW77733.1 MAG TPA: hypothetical protein [Bacteriophage sp.]